MLVLDNAMGTGRIKDLKGAIDETTIDSPVLETGGHNNNNRIALHDRY